MSKGKHIIIDIGHAIDTGARGQGMEEHARCTLIADCLATRLRAAGYTVTVLDYPEMSNRADLVATVKAANALPAAFGISLHMDCAKKWETDGVDEDGQPVERCVDDTRPHGGHVCYVSNKGKRMAAAIASFLCKLLPGRAESIVKRAGLYILSHTRAPWVLVECGFITNPADAATPVDDVAAAICQGVSKYFAAA